MGPKPVAGEDQTGFSPDDRNILNFSCIIILNVQYFSCQSTFKHKYWGFGSILYTTFKVMLNIE